MTTAGTQRALYLAGLADADGARCDVLVGGHAYGSLSMIAYTLGTKCPPVGDVVTPAAGLPEPGVVPPEGTNV